MLALLTSEPKFVSPNAALPWSGFCQIVMIGMPAEPKYEYTSASSGQRQMFAASSSTQHNGTGRRRLLPVNSDWARWNAVNATTAVRLAVNAVEGRPWAESRYRVSSLVANS